MTKTIDLTPTWKGLLPALLALIEKGTPEGRRMALEELTRMADAADLYNSARKALNVAGPLPVTVPINEED